MNSIQELTDQEFNRQKNSLNLIASENYPSPKVLQLLGSVWSNKYAEGFPGKRYYAGNQFTDELEVLVQQKALKVFKAQERYGVNVQVLSGSPANSTVFLAVLNAGDTILSMNLTNGGHLSHLHKTSNWNKFFQLINYDVKPVKEHTFEIDFDDYKNKLEEYKPNLVIIGFSAYPRQYEFNQMCKIAHEAGVLVLADIAHINGLVAAGVHDSPFLGPEIETADFVSMTTHKTFRGPRGAMLFARNNLPEFISREKYPDLFNASSLIEVIDKTVFPGTSGGPHVNKIAAIGQACLEILGEDSYPDKINFETYSQNVIDNCQALEKGLLESGLQIISPTQNHLCLIELPEKTDSLKMQKQLESLGIITNRNAIPFDQKTAWKPSGMRFGSAALTSRGLSNPGFQNLGNLIGNIIFDKVNEDEAKKQIQELLDSLNWWY